MSGWVNARQLKVIDYLREENRVLREQFCGRWLRFTDDRPRRLAVKGRIVGRCQLGEFAGLVTHDTNLRWYRELIASKYDGSARCRPGRPVVATDVEQLVVRCATENPTSGYTRLIGVLGNLRLLQRYGLEPAPMRGKRMPWKTFLRTHLGVTATADFFSVEVLTWTELFRYVVLFVIDLQTRQVQICGVMRPAYGAWMKQVASNLTDGVDGFLTGKRYLLHDWVPLFTGEFRDVLASAGVKCLRLPVRRPDLNFIALPRRAHPLRDRQPAARTADQPMRPANSNAPAERRERLGGLLNFYYRRAACTHNRHLAHDGRHCDAC